MSAPAVMETEKAYFVRAENRQKLLDFETNFRPHPLLDSEAYVNAHGNIAYLTYPDIPQGIELFPNFVSVHKGKPSGVIFDWARDSNTEKKEVSVRHVHGGVEKAIRNMDKILEETVKVRTMGSRAHELLDLFSYDFAAITPERFQEARDKTVQLLERVGLDPAATIDDETGQIEAWLVKGSFGKDSLGRRNRLITTMALSASYHHALTLWKDIGPKTKKFIEMRKALIYEREFCRAMFTDVLRRIRPEAIPAHALFKYPEKKPDNVGIVLAMLDHIQFQLTQPRVNPYRPVGQEASALIAQAATLLEENKNNRSAIVQQERDLFKQAFNELTHTLLKYRLISTQDEQH